MLQIAMTKETMTPDEYALIGFLPGPKARDDLYARRFLLDTGTVRTLVVTLDYDGLGALVREVWQKRLAAACNTTFEHIWLEEKILRLETAVRTLPKHLIPVTRLGWSEIRLSGYASNRRVEMLNGSIAIRMIWFFA